MWYLHSVNKGRTLLKFIVYLKALRKIFANVSKFLHVNTKSNVKTRNENRQGNSTKERMFSILMGSIPRGKMLYNRVSGEEFGESLVFSEGMISRIKTIILRKTTRFFISSVKQERLFFTLPNWSRFTKLQRRRRPASELEKFMSGVKSDRFFNLQATI